MLIESFSNADTLSALPRPVRVDPAPLNPPEAIQTKFVGASYNEAFTEASAFVNIVARSAQDFGKGLGSGPVIDFGSGWGRISRFLLQHVDATSLYAVDVDCEMTALVNTTMPGLNTLTVSPLPPTALRDEFANTIVAFSVFSHLSPTAHEAWAEEFGRLIQDDGIVCITVLGKRFLRQVAAAKEAFANGDRGIWTVDLANMFHDVAAAREEYKTTGIVYSPRTEDGIRTEDYYGWAAASKAYVNRVWGAQGFEIVAWIPPAEPIGQVVVALRKQPRVPRTHSFESRKIARAISHRLRRKFRG